MSFYKKPIALWARMLTASVICLLIAQYIANSHPLDQIFRFGSLICLMVAAITFYRWSRNPDSSSNQLNGNR